MSITYKEDMEYEEYFEMCSKEGLDPMTLMPTRERQIQTAVTKLKAIHDELEYNPELDMDINEFSKGWSKDILAAVESLGDRMIHAKEPDLVPCKRADMEEDASRAMAIKRNINGQEVEIALTSQELYEASKAHTLNFMADEFESRYGCGEETARGYAECAFDRYSDGDGFTEYECIEQIAEEADLKTEDFDYLLDDWDGV